MLISTVLSFRNLHFGNIWFMPGECLNVNIRRVRTIVHNIGIQGL